MRIYAFLASRLIVSAAGLALGFAVRRPRNPALGEPAVCRRHRARRQGWQAIEQGRDPFAPFAAILDSADIRIGNLECVVATGGDPADKNFTFRAHPRTLPVLKRHFDAVALANNHSGDYGRAAFAEMLGLLDREASRNSAAAIICARRMRR